MGSFFKSIFKEEHLNSLLITAVFLFLTVWWAFVYFGLGYANVAANNVWTSYYQITAILGAYIGYFVFYHLPKNNPHISRKLIFIFASGLLFQFFGQAVFTCYILFYGLNSPYPSYADIFFFSSISIYLVAISILYYIVIAKSDLKKAALTSVGWLIVISSIEAWLLYRTGYHITLSPAGLTDICYLTVDTISSSLALGALVSTKFFSGYKYRWAYAFLLLGIVSQFFADFGFTYGFQLGTWLPTSFYDYLYLVAYFVMSLGIVQFTTSFIAINILVVLFNALFFVQLLLSSSLDRLFSNGILLFVCLAVSYFLLRRNKKESSQREKLARFEALEESNRKLLELDRQKTEFLTIAAHHLRTPVSIMRNYLAMIQDGDYGAVNSGLVPILANMDISNQWLVRLADEFVAIASLEQGVTKYHISSTNLTELIAQIVRELTPRAKEQGLAISFEKPAETFTLPLDAEKIRQAFMNLLDNAIKYSDRGTITVTVRAEDGGSAVRVVDQGIGFSPEDLPNFFQKFRRGKNAKALHVNTSTGLGLYIAKMFVEGHKGRVWAKSEGDGKGSEFGFWIPSNTSAN